MDIHELIGHLRQRGAREQRLGARRQRIIGEQRDQLLQIVAVVVEERRRRVARQIAGRRDAIQGRHRLVDER
jgi:hypothetical protein